MKAKELIIIGALSLLPFGVYAADYQTSEQKSFQELDTNHDGYISKNEAKADHKLMKDWKSADANKDGKLEESEFSAFETRNMGSTPMKQ